MNHEVTSAIIAASVALLVCVVSWYLNNQAQRNAELLSMRRDVLLQALEVIDHVYANTSLDGKPPANSYEWDISAARKAMNGMIVFCNDPEKTVEAFTKAIGLHNPHSDQPRAKINPKDLEAFRRVVSEELSLSSATTYENKDNIWILSLPGGK